MRIALEPAFLLHRKPYRDSSRIYDFFTLEHGVISVMAKGVWRKEKGGSLASLIQPFTPLLISFVGRASLKTLSKVELADNHKNLIGERIFCALYLNELLLKLVGRNIPYPELFGYYSKSLDALKSASSVEEPLRSFELFLLAELGYEIDLETDSTGVPISECANYLYEPNYGFTKIQSEIVNESMRYLGRDILAMAKGEFNGVSAALKRLLRVTLSYHLGEKELQSRSLFPSK